MFLSVRPSIFLQMQILKIYGNLNNLLILPSLFINDFIISHVFIRILLVYYDDQFF